MTRRAKPLPPRVRGGVDLSNVSDTSTTTGNPPSERRKSKRKNSGSSEKVEPPFSGERDDHAPITWRQIAAIGKVVAGVATFVVTIVIPMIWFASRIDTSVGILQEDVKEVKGKTQELVINSIRNSERLDNLESSYSSINMQLKSKAAEEGKDVAGQTAASRGSR